MKKEESGKEASENSALVSIDAVMRQSDEEHRNSFVFQDRITY